MWQNCAFYFSESLDMSTTAVSNALKKARLAIPLNQRTWMWLKDHDEKTSKEIAVALNESQGNVSSILGDMVRRKMVLVSKKLSEHSRSNVNYYKTSAKLKTFKLLPKVVDKPVTVANAVPEAPTPSPARAKPSIDSLSVKEAFDLYKELKVMFAPAVS